MTLLQESAVSTAARGMTITIQLCEELDLSTVHRVREQLQDVLAVRPKAVVVDLTRCTFLDSQGLALLLEAHRESRRRQVGFALRGLSAAGLRLLALSGLEGVFDLVDA